jgi:hypothetical protein
LSDSLDEQRLSDMAIGSMLLFGVAEAAHA